MSWFKSIERWLKPHGLSAPLGPSEHPGFGPVTQKSARRLLDSRDWAELFPLMQWQARNLEFEALNNAVERERKIGIYQGYQLFHLCLIQLAMGGEQEAELPVPEVSMTDFYAKMRKINEELAAEQAAQEDSSVMSAG